MTPLDLISLIEAKDYLQVDFPDKDTLITSLIKSSIEQIEGATDRRLYERDEVITTNKEVYTTVVYPINSVVSIMEGTTELVLDTDYAEDDNTYARIFEFNSEDVRTITLTVGYEAGECPESLKLACLNLIEYNYNNRGAADIPANVAQRISTFRRSPW